ncbi:MAG: glycosyltransferase [Planctomycetota bacterium]|jgi:glycosyltransferase involved in cell wall biosynthesis|nr:glycosyltransferase [Planctomycetota bacterium]
MAERERPLFSVVTVCKDAAGVIGGTCESVAGQTFGNFEWIVVDGASSDGTAEALSGYRRRMAHFLSEPDGGAYHAMNKGLALARGEYLIFMNGGDAFAADTVLAQVVAAGLSAEVVYGNEVKVYPDGEEEVCSSRPAEGISRLAFAGHNGIPHQAAFIRRELFDRFGPYDQGLRIVADWEKWIVFAAGGCSFAKLELAVSRFRMGGVSTSGERRREMEAEKREVRRRHFTPAEVRKGRRLFKRLSRYRRTGGFFPLFSTEATPTGNKRRIRFLGFPLLRIQTIGRRRSFSLFGLLPVWKSGIE